MTGVTGLQTADRLVTRLWFVAGFMTGVITSPDSVKIITSKQLAGTIVYV